MGAGLIRIILTGLDFDVLLPITDITGRQAYFSLITSNSYSPAPAGHTRAVCMYVNVYPCVNAFFFPFFFFGCLAWLVISTTCLCVFGRADVFLSRVK